MSQAKIIALNRYASVPTLTFKPWLSYSYSTNVISNGRRLTRAVPLPSYVCIYDEHRELN